MNLLTTYLRLRWTLLLMLCCSVACKRYGEPEWENLGPEAANISILDLHRSIDNRDVIIEQDIVIGGYVTSDDRASNFHRTFTIEDSSGGVEIMAGLYDLHNSYPMGYYVSVNLKGCAVAESNGVMQVGMPAAEYSGYATDYFSARAILDKYVKCYNIKNNITPLQLDVSTLQREHCGRLVNIDSLQNYGQSQWSGYSLFCNEQGDSVMVYTSQYANYAQKKIPSGKVSLTGILQYGKVEGREYYIVKMRDEKDCHSHN